MIALLAEDITLWSDGGGQVTAALKPLHGNVKVAKFLLAIRSKKLANYVSRIAKVNDQPGIINYIGDRVAAALQHRLHSVMTFDFRDNRIQSVFIVVNPEKLKQLADLNIKY
ncbi:MAG: hypothetical protein HC862_19920 [Scytonema sp. RU_4_4]|nr:hypothetical protein [Scytonema sp. RU_4_4]